MKIYTKTILKLVMFLLILAGSVVSCKDDDNIDMSKIDFSNIENLYEQPLPVIQKCVQGKWKWIRIYQYGVVGIIYPSNTFVNITENSVVITGENDFIKTFSYSWKKMNTSSGNMTYVMWNNEQNRAEWYFNSIKNDSLSIDVDKVDKWDYESYLFSRIK